VCAEYINTANDPAATAAFDRLHWIQRATTPIVVGGLVYLALFVFFKGAVTTLLDGILSGIPFLNKYIIYTSAEPAQSGIAIDKSSSQSHLAYAVAVSTFTFSCFFVKSEKIVAFRPYILFSYAIFQILEVSPITAYRQSLFWLIPVALVYPWDKFAKGPMSNAALAAGSFAVFIYSAHTVYN